jgi:hypothetical protein
VAADQFACTITRDGNGRITTITIVTTSRVDGLRRIEVDAGIAAVVDEVLYSMLRQGGVTTRQWIGRQPFQLDEAPGVRAELLLRAVAPLRTPERVRWVAQGVSAMGIEEAYYWFSLACRGPTGLRALRVLFSGPGAGVA